jgi:4-hydroxy-tetrahydrodipicolinate synthase
MTNPFIGTGVAVITPFDAQKNIDILAIQRLTAHLIAGKVEYLVVLGSTGEAATLSASEKRQVLDAYFDAAAGRIPIVIGSGGNDTREVVQNTTDFAREYPQAAGFLSVSPYYNKPSQEGIFQHYKAISEAVSQPIIMYNVPGRTGSNVTADTTLRIAEELHNIVANKEASGNLMHQHVFMLFRVTTPLPSAYLPQVGRE